MAGIINDYPYNTIGDPAPWAELESENFAILLGFVPAPGQTLTDNHHHSNVLSKSP